MVFRRCRRLLGDEDRALDATQDVFVQVQRHRERLLPEHASSLLYRIATRICLNLLRSERRSPLVLGSSSTGAAVTTSDPVLAAIADLADPESTGLARSLLSRLFAREPESTRVMAVLFFVDGLTLEETAREVGLSVSGVRKRLRALRERLHGLVDPAAPLEEIP